MKKVIILVMLMLAICSVSFAEESRWIPIYEDEVSSVAIDSSRISSYGTKDDPYLNCWLKWYIPEVGTTYEHTFIRANSKAYMVKECIMYDDKNVLLSKTDDSSKGWITPIPNTPGDYAVKNALQWAAKKGL